MLESSHERQPSYPPPPLMFTTPPPPPTPPPPSSSISSQTPPLSQTKDESKIHVTMVVVFYMIVSISMILINKTLLDSISLPFTLLWGQLVVAVSIMSFLGIFNRLPPLRLDILPSIIPLVVMNVIGLTINTFFLKEIDAVMYQVGRSMLLPMTVILTPLIMGEGVGGFWVVVSCCIITTGYIIGMGIAGSLGFEGFSGLNGLIGGPGDGNYLNGLSGGLNSNVTENITKNINWKGVWLGLGSSFTTTIHSFVIKISFRRIKHNSTWSLLWYNNLGSLIILTPFLLGELDGLSSLSKDNVSLLLYGSLLAGSTGLLINLAGFLQLKVTSPLSHMVSSISRGVIQTLITYSFFGDLLNEERIIGILITLVGSSMYILSKN